MDDLPRPAGRATRIEVSCLPLDHNQHYHFTVNVEWRGKDRWAVTRNGECYGRDGTWSYESLPSNREDEWLNNYRYPYGEAIQVAMKLAPTLRSNGHPLTEILGLEQCPGNHFTEEDDVAVG